jgi:hypothetical protein
MKQTPSIGMNRTGIASHEMRTKEMQAGMDEFAPSSRGSSVGADRIRILYARSAEKGSRGLGSVPAPAGVKGKMKAAADVVLGHQPTLFMDKMSERIAFERTGTRLYEVLISKHEADEGFGGGPSREDLLQILEEEHRHFAMLVEDMRTIGGDPTAMTPSADIAGTAAMGVLKVVTDARTTLLQGLEAILVAELTDRDGWHALIALARHAGKDDLVERYEAAEAREAEHIEKVRGWIAAGHLGTAEAAE